MRLKISFSLQEGKMHVLWKSRRARMLSSSRSVAPSTCTHFVCLTRRRLKSWSNLSLPVSMKKLLFINGHDECIWWLILVSYLSSLSTERPYFYWQLADFSWLSCLQVWACKTCENGTWTKHFKWLLERMRFCFGLLFVFSVCSIYGWFSCILYLYPSGLKLVWN